MQYSEGSLGRVFVLRFENGDDLIGSVENMAGEKGIGAGASTPKVVCRSVDTTAVDTLWKYTKK
jgi:predicted DNA-binding protein with PD1-like motif